MGATLESRLPQIAAELRPRVSAAVKAGSELIAARAREIVPVLEQPTPDREPGALRDSIAVRRAGPAAYRVGAGSSEAFYARFVELGTEAMEAEPFLIPAAEGEQEQLVAGVAAALRTL